MTDVYAFECDKKHVFFTPMKLPMDAAKLIDALDGLTCPICRSRHMRIDPRVKQVTCNSDIN